MKRIFILLLLSLILNESMSQTFPKLWGKGKEKTVDGHLILKEAGGGSPYISWKSKETYKEETIKRSKKELWSADSLQKELNFIDEKASGGILYIYVVRLTAVAANTDNFTLIVFSAEDKELFRKKFDSNVANFEIIGKETYWKNYGAMFIPVELKTPFKFIIIDGLSDLDKENYIYVIKS